MRSLVDNRSVVIKNTGKGSCEVLWDCEDYGAVAKGQVDANDLATSCIILAISYLETFKTKRD